LPILETEIYIETEYGELHNVPARFHVSVEKVRKEPFTTGESRGSYKDVCVSLTSLVLNKLTLNIHQIILAFGAEVVDKIEQHEVDSYYD